MDSHLRLPKRLNSREEPLSTTTTDFCNFLLAMQGLSLMFEKNFLDSLGRRFIPRLLSMPWHGIELALKLILVDSTSISGHYYKFIFLNVEKLWNF